MPPFVRRIVSQHFSRLGFAHPRILIGIAAILLAALLAGLAAAGADTDGDGLPDDYEIAHHLDPANPTDATTDADGDTLDALAEYAADTNPNAVDTDGDGFDDASDPDPISRVYLDFSQTAYIDGTTFRAPRPNWLRSVKSSKGQWVNGTWSSVGTSPLNINLKNKPGLLRVDVVGSANHGLRVQVILPGGVVHSTTNLPEFAEGLSFDLQLPAGKPIVRLRPHIKKKPRRVSSLVFTSVHLYDDDDLDGLDGAHETAIGTDQTLTDTDGDGMADGYEARYGLNPLDATDAHQDPDGDGLSNVEEYNLPGGPANPTLHMARDGGRAGHLQAERWINIPGDRVSDLLDSAAYRTGTPAVQWLDQAAAPSGTAGTGDHYGLRIRGTITAPVSGEYRFWVSGDDNLQLSL